MEQFLKTVPLFETLTEEEMAEVGRAVEAKTYPEGTVIVEEGSAGDSLYVVRSGSVRIEKKRGAVSVKLADLQTGAFFGEMAILDDTPHSANVVTNEESEILLLRRLDLEIILNWNTVLGMRIWRTFAQVLSNRLRETNERILEKMLEAENTQKFKMWGEMLHKP